MQIGQGFYKSLVKVVSLSFFVYMKKTKKSAAGRALVCT